MRIGKERIKGLTQKDIASGLAYYWQPNPAEREMGWAGMALGSDLAAAVTCAKQRNSEIAGWKDGGAKPRQVKAYIKKSTFGHVIKRYRKEVLATKRASTQRVDETAIRRLDQWAGDVPFAWITRKRVKALRNAMMDGVVIDGPGHAPAFHLLTTLRKICGWWIKEAELNIDNPAGEFDLPAPSPRDQIWEADTREAIVAATREVDMLSIALAFDLACYIGQREDDILKLERSRWREISLSQLDHDQTLYDALKSDHGPDADKVMGIYVKQGKTRRWIAVPIEGALRDRVEAAIAAIVGRARVEGRVVPQHFLIAEHTGEPWGQSDFIHKFAAIRELAAANARAGGEDDLSDRLLALNFQDTRRTCIVTLGMLGLNDYTIGSISGHSQATIKKILETYMPRTEAAAARGVVARIGHNSRHAERGAEREKSA